MSDIQRLGGDSMLFEDSFGDLVKYDDHAAIVALLETELAEAKKDIERKTLALKKIAKWHDEFPPSCRFNEDGTQMSFGAAFGSNGQRDYMRGVAQLAIDAAIASIQDKT
jgi:hypothetical protein